MSKDDKIVFQPKTEAIYKIIIIGDPSVGKTSLLSKFADKKFTQEYIPTVGVNIVKHVVNIQEDGNDISINLLFWDIAGQPQFYMLHKPYFNGADGIILVFPI